MPANPASPQSVVVLDEAEEITLADLTRTCRVHAEWVMELIEEGVLEPRQAGGAQWRFSATSIVRVEKARRLQRDLGVNLPGIALALQLLDRIDALEARLRSAPLRAPVDTDTEWRAARESDNHWTGKHFRHARSTRHINV
jgi:chaperone modulatory protein CbpM